MNTAQKLYAAWLNVPDYEGVDLRIAAQQTRDEVLAARAPHANRGTPPRLRYPGHRQFKLFKGHRP